MNAILEKRARYYSKYVLAQANYMAFGRFSDLLDYIEYGIASKMLTKEEIYKLIAKQDKLGQEILVKQFARYL